MNITPSAIQQVWTVHQMTNQTLVHLSLFFSALVIVIILGLTLGIVSGIRPKPGNLMI